MKKIIKLLLILLVSFSMFACAKEDNKYELVRVSVDDTTSTEFEGYFELNNNIKPTKDAELIDAKLLSGYMKVMHKQEVVLEGELINFEFTEVEQISDEVFNVVFSCDLKTESGTTSFVGWCTKTYDACEFWTFNIFFEGISFNFDKWYVDVK